MSPAEAPSFTDHINRYCQIGGNFAASVRDFSNADGLDFLGRNSIEGGFEEYCQVEQDCPILAAKAASTETKNQELRDRQMPLPGPEVD